MRSALLSILLASTIASAETLVMSSAASTVPLTVREGTQTYNCNISGPSTITGSFNNIRTVMVTRMGIITTGCFQPVVQPPQPPSGASVAFSTLAYSTYLSIGKTYLALKRVGSTAGSLAIDWSSTGGLTPSAGKLYWAAGETSAKYVVVTPSALGVAKITIPGSTTTLTVK